MKPWWTCSPFTMAGANRKQRDRACCWLSMPAILLVSIWQLQEDRLLIMCPAAWWSCFLLEALHKTFPGRDKCLLARSLTTLSKAWSRLPSSPILCHKIPEKGEVSAIRTAVRSWDQLFFYSYHRKSDTYHKSHQWFTLRISWFEWFGDTFLSASQAQQ